MAEYDTDSIQVIVYLYPRFEGKDKTHFLEYKDKLRVSLSFHWQSVAAILEGEPKPITTQNLPGCGDVDAREREPFRHLILHDRAFCPQCRKKAHGQDPGGWGR